MRSSRRFSSLSLAALASGFVVLAVGTAVAIYMGNRIQSSALSNARQNAEYIARLGFAPRLGRIGTGFDGFFESCQSFIQAAAFMERSAADLEALGMIPVLSQDLVARKD